MKNPDNSSPDRRSVPSGADDKAAVQVVLLCVVSILIISMVLPACMVQEKEEKKKEEEKKSSLPAFAQEALEMAREAQKQQKDIAKRQQAMIEEMERGYTAGPESAQQAAQWQADRDAITDMIKKNAEKISSMDVDGYLQDFDPGSTIARMDRDTLRQSLETAQIKIEIVSVTVQQLTQSEATARVVRKDYVGGAVKTNNYSYSLNKTGNTWKILNVRQS